MSANQWAIQSVQRSSPNLFRFVQNQRQFYRPLKKRAFDLVRLFVESAFITNSCLMRIDSDQIAFLRDNIHWQIVYLLADNDKFRGRAILAVVSKLECDVARGSENLIFAFPLALDLFGDRRSVKRRFYLRRPGSLENEWRPIPGLHKIPGESPVSDEAAFETRLQTASSFDSKGCVRILHRNVSERRACNI